MRGTPRLYVLAQPLGCAIALTLASCKPQPVLAPPPSPSPVAEVAQPLEPEIPEAEKPVITLPPAPVLTQAGTAFLISTGGHALILDFETGGRAGYDPNPEWPRGQSGVTIGIGYDLGYHSRNVILSDWQALAQSDRMRLAVNAGLTGQRAAAKISGLRDIYVQWAIAVDVFDRVDIAREFASAKRAMPGFEDLRANAQAAIISLGFNRGWQMSGPNRVEFRAIRDLVPSRDYEGIALNLRKMARVWAGRDIYNGMKRRREAEARLVMTP